MNYQKINNYAKRTEMFFFYVFGRKFTIKKGN